jgi:beta-galactosidase/beta-glucuronidase
MKPLRADVEWTKKFGFNAARKHQKIEDPRYLYWCDKLGVLVWGEMANARKWSPQSRRVAAGRMGTRCAPRLQSSPAS